MYKFDEKTLKEAINMGLGSQGIWTTELADIMFDEITSKALRVHDVSNRREQLISFADTINIHDGDKDKIEGLVDLYLKSN
jgi:hypothetical protein